MALLVISPHLDDAVFACGELIARHPGAVVLTVFAGVPDKAQITQWDRGCGFADSRAAMCARRREDREALALLQAMPCWLDFYDAQYARAASAGEIAAKLADELGAHAPDTVALPLGLFHSDHKLASRAALALVDDERTWLVYEDALYRRIAGAVDERLGELRAMGFALSPVADGKGAPALKGRAIECYASQLRGLATPGRPGHADLGAPERYWRIRR
jgi:LmbE family N-acetylglucosaminyl deacetylase